VRRKIIEVEADFSPHDFAWKSIAHSPPILALGASSARCGATSPHFTVASQKASGARAPPPMTHTYRLFTHYTTMPARPVLGSISGNIPRKKELTPLRTRYYCWEGFCQYCAYPNCRGAFHTAFNGSRDSLPRRHVSSSFRCTKKVVKAWQTSYFTSISKGATDHVCAAHPRAHPCRLARHHLPTTQGPPYNQLACKIASFTYRGVCQSPS
jgi:hypothetical protein